MIKRNPRPQIDSQNYDRFSEEKKEAALAVWKHLALSGEKDLKYAYLRKADLQGANLHGVDLYGANLEGADLQGANLYYANLQGADLQSANLQGGNLEDANLLGANLYDANLLFADLTAVEYLTDEQLRSARNVIQLQSSEFSEIPEDLRSYAPLNRLLKAQTLRK